MTIGRIMIIPIISVHLIQLLTLRKIILYHYVESIYHSSIHFVDVTVYEVLLLSRPPENFSIPMVLIQDVDAIPFLQFIFHQQKYVDVSGALFGITKTKEIIPSPKVCFKFSYHMILITRSFIVLIILYLWFFLIYLFNSVHL